MTSPNPSTRWDVVPVFGSWQRFDGTTESGRISLTVSQRINRTDGRVIYPGGAAVTVTIGDQSQQDAAIRVQVRAAWRAADEAALGEDFDGAAWDEWWETVLVKSAIFTSFPASDDPDITPQGYQVQVEERLDAGKGKQYTIQPLLAHLEQSIPGINLGDVEVPPGSPTVPAPIYAKGQPGGVAPLDETGKVPVANLPDNIGGASSVDDLTDATEVGKSVVKAATVAVARGAIGAVATTDPRLSDARTPTAHNHPASGISDSTATGRSLVTAASAAAARSAIGAGTSSITTASTAEAQAGTDTAKAVTPAGLAAAAVQKRSEATGLFGGVYATEGDIPTGSLGPSDAGTWFIIQGA